MKIKTLDFIFYTIDISVCNQMSDKKSEKVFDNISGTMIFKQ